MALEGGKELRHEARLMTGGAAEEVAAAATAMEVRVDTGTVADLDENKVVLEPSERVTVTAATGTEVEAKEPDEDVEGLLMSFTTTVTVIPMMRRRERTRSPFVKPAGGVSKGARAGDDPSYPIHPLLASLRLLLRSRPPLAVLLVASDPPPMQPAPIDSQRAPSPELGNANVELFGGGSVRARGLVPSSLIEGPECPGFFPLPRPTTSTTEPAA